MLKLIADTGATKSSWRLLDGSECVGQLETEGINVAISGVDLFSEVLRHNVFAAFPRADEMFLYVAGAVDKDAERECSLRAQQCYPGAKCSVFSDVMGAARACCGHSAGIACILGTGINTCFFDGETLHSKLKSGGFILGDEGSGAYLGKRLLSDYLKGLMPAELSDALTLEYKLDYSNIVASVYRSEKPGKYLASFSPFVLGNQTHPWMKSFIGDCFREFVQRNIYAYPKQYPVNFVGSIAWFYRDYLSAALEEAGYSLGKIIRNPIEGLVEYHR